MSTKSPPYQPSYDSDEADAIQATEHRCHCGRTFASAHALKIHTVRGHRSAAKRKPKPLANGRLVATADELREAVAKLDRLDEARAEIEQLEREVDELLDRLVKAWR